MAPRHGTARQGTSRHGTWRAQPSPSYFTDLLLTVHLVPALSRSWRPDPPARQNSWQGMASLAARGRAGGTAAWTAG